MKNFKKLARYFNFYINNIDDLFKDQFEYILSQWALESGYGQSKLAKEFYNFGGMKYRKEISSEFFKSDFYVDWSDNRELYFKLDDYCFYPSLYTKFIERSPYKGFEKHLKDGKSFIKFIAKSGYCGSMKDVEKKDVPKEYLKLIEGIRNSDKFKEVLNYAYDI